MAVKTQDIKSMVALALDLDEQATDGPWTVRHWGTGCYELRAFGDTFSVTPGSFGHRPNYALAAESRTIMPALAREVERQGEVIAQLRRHTGCRGSCCHTTPPTPPKTANKPGDPT